MEAEITDFDCVAAALTVSSICEEITDKIPAGCDIAEAADIIGDEPQGVPARVVDSNGFVVGFVWHEELDAEEFGLTRVMERVERNCSPPWVKAVTAAGGAGFPAR